MVRNHENNYMKITIETLKNKALDYKFKAIITYAV